MSIAEALARALMEGMELFARGVFRLLASAAGRGQELTWSDAAPSDAGERKAILERVRPAGKMIIRLAQTVDDTVQILLARQRKALAEDADFVLGLREDWDPEKRDRLEGIRTVGQR